MEFLNAKISHTAVRREQYPTDGLPEIALVGRSNVGKSSLINCLVNRKKLARTSGSPGKTATINFYEIDGKFRIVDLPGYGYAKVSKVEKEKWGRMIDAYLSERINLMQIIQLVDSRHKPTEDDKIMMDWVRNSGYDPVVVANKLDKLKKSQIDENLTIIYNELKLDENSILIPFSAEKKNGKEELQELISEIYDEFLSRQISLD